MSKTIYKYPLQIIDEQWVNIPKGAEILTVQIQNGIPCLWAKVDAQEDNERRLIEIIGTGNPISNSDRKYISTIQLEKGKLVFHVFEYLGL